MLLATQALYREDFTELSDEIKQYYSDKIEFLKVQRGYKQGEVMHVIDYTRGWGSRNDRIDQRKTTFTNCLARHVSNAKRFITYLDRNCKRDKLLNRILDWYYSPHTDKKVIDLYAASNNIYENAEYLGVRKRKNSSMYYYRIKMKLPNGTPVNIEKGSFYSPEEANKARKQHLILLTTQGCNNSDKTVEDVFFEFISDTCKLKPSLEKKYLSYYNSRIKDRMGNLKIGETLNALENLYNQITHYQVKDMRTKDSSITLTPNYVSGLRAMLCNLFDYAYNKKYIRSHPMYALPSKWTTEGEERFARTKEKNNYIQPLFAYLGNKHKLLPDIQKLFPKNIDMFIDLFSGSSVVGINCDAKQVLINDSNLFLIGIYKGIQETTPDAAWRMIETIINKYSLTKENEDGYYLCREDYNKILYEERCNKYWYWGLVLVWCSFNRSTVQFNLQNEYNAPFGFSKVNFDLAKQKFFAFAKKVSGSKIVFTCDDYKNIDVQAGAFVYIDPPYLITTATYNKGWDKQAENELYNYLETLDNKGVKWAMSNVLENNGENHTMLSDWISRKKYRVHYLDGEYIHANFRRKNKGRTVEVLITNY